MGKFGLDKVLDCFSLYISSNSCFCMNSFEEEEEEEENVGKKAFIASHNLEMLKLKDLDAAKTLASHLEPKTVVLKVSMHCNGCARKVEKHISKMEGVSSFEVDLQSKKVVVKGDITPFEVLASVSKVKFAQLWINNSA